MSLNVSDLIKKSLDYYDNTKSDYLMSDNKIYIDKSINKAIIYDSKDINKILLKTDYEILGVFDNQTKVWCWAWLLPYLTINETIISRKLLDYGLKLDPQTNNNDHYYIKSQLLNSRISIENSVELDIHLALSTYLIKDQFNFLWKNQIFFNEELSKYITVYYLIK